MKNLITTKRVKLLSIYILLLIGGVFTYNAITNYDPAKNEYKAQEYKVDLSRTVSEKISEDELTNEEALQSHVNQKFGTIYIPDVDLDVDLIQSASDNDADMQVTMHDTVGHEPGSYLPGEGKQIVLTGHREEDFAALADVTEGDDVFVTVGDNVYLYEIYETKIVDPMDPEGINYVRGETDTEELVMYTCYPFEKFTPVTDRFVVRAKRVSTLKIPNDEYEKLEQIAIDKKDESGNN